MTDWREELIEKMARSICDLYKLNPNDWRHWRKECRAALAVAEPVIREQCAQECDRRATFVGNGSSEYSLACRHIAGVIREGGE